MKLIFLKLALDIVLSVLLVFKLIWDMQRFQYLSKVPMILTVLVIASLLAGNVLVIYK